MCKRPQENIPVHLAKICMKNSTQDEISAEVQRAKDSSKNWISRSRTWDYDCICALLPDPRSRNNLVEEFISLGFFVNNLPQESGASAGAEAGASAGADFGAMYGLEVKTSHDDRSIIEDSQQILRLARPDCLKIKADLETDADIPEVDKTKRPIDVEAFKDSEWVDRVKHGDRVVLGVKMERNVSVRIALTEEDEDFCLCTSQRSGLGTLLQRKPGAISSRAVPGRRPKKVLRMAAKTLKPQQQESVRQYLQPDVFGLGEVVEAALLLEYLASTTKEDVCKEKTETGDVVSVEQPSDKMSKFFEMFQVLIDEAPPGTKERRDAGFEERVFYDSLATCFSSRLQKQLKKGQMSGHVRTSQGPQKHLRPQRVKAFRVDIKTELAAFRDSPAKDMKEELCNLKQEVNQKLNGLVTDLNATAERIDEAEQRVADLEENTAELKEVLGQSIQIQENLQERLLDLEARSRRNNIRIFGIPEGCEENNAQEFVESIIKTELSLGDLDLKIQRCHRALGPKPPTDAYPRSVVVFFLEYKTKELVLRSAWRKKEVNCNGKRIFFDQDYPPEIQQKRRHRSGKFSKRKESNSKRHHLQS
ncbi:unnamed protein product [Leuciscus chuanchicus]